MARVHVSTFSVRICNINGTSISTEYFEDTSTDMLELAEARAEELAEEYNVFDIEVRSNDGTLVRRIESEYLNNVREAVNKLNRARKNSLFGT